MKMRDLIRIVEDSNTFDVTETEEFKNWFSGSKIVDKQSRPLRVYHGTTSTITKFGNHDDIPYRGGIIAFFSTSPEFASDYATTNRGANVMPCYLRCLNPFDFRKNPEWAEYFWSDTGGLSDQSDINRILIGLGDQSVEDIFDEGHELSEEQFVSAVASGSWDAIEASEFVEYLREHGFDCIVTLENEAINFGIFEPSQVKSAFNKGSFDPDQEDVSENLTGR